MALYQRLTDMNRFRRRATAAALVLGLGVLAACADQPPSAGGPAGATPPSTPSPAASPTPAPSPTQPAGSPTPSAAAGHVPPISFTRSGGVAGVVETLAIVDGTARLSSRGLPGARMSPLTRTEAAALARAVKRARIGEVAPGSSRLKWERGSRDTFGYSVTVGTISVRAADGVVPSQLKELLRVLQGVANRLRATG